MLVGSRLTYRNVGFVTEKVRRWSTDRRRNRAPSRGCEPHGSIFAASFKWVRRTIFPERCCERGFSKRTPKRHHGNRGRSSRIREILLDSLVALIHTGRTYRSCPWSASAASAAAASLINRASRRRVAHAPRPHAASNNNNNSRPSVVPRRVSPIWDGRRGGDSPLFRRRGLKERLRRPRVRPEIDKAPPHRCSIVRWRLPAFISIDAAERRHFINACA